MKALSLAAFFYLSLSFQFAQSLSPTYSTCQLQKSSGQSALVGCPEGTLYVSPTDTSAHFTGVQQAINSLPESGDAVILIGKGDYLEAINVARSAPLTLLGQLDPSTASTGNASTRNIVRIWNEQCAHADVTDEMTATLTVVPAEYQPFGSVDFRAYNINFDNAGCASSVSQALVTQFTYSNVSFYGCTFSSYQDTWYTGYGANSYVVDSIILGQTDYLFGFGIAWFQSVTLANRGCGGGITAWQGTSGASNGVYIVDSKIIRSPDADPSTITKHSCYLGRPWNQYALAVYHRNYMDDSINPAGFRPWYLGGSIPDTTYFAEYASYGPGGSTSARVAQDHILNSAQGNAITIHSVFGGIPSWIDHTYKTS